MPLWYRRAHPFNPLRSLLTYSQKFAINLANFLMVKDSSLIICQRLDLDTDGNKPYISKLEAIESSAFPNIKLGENWRN